MAITNGYTTLVAIKARLGIADTTDDATLESIVTSVSRAIRNWCGRSFAATTQTRYFTAEHHVCLLVDDLLSVTTLKTDADGDGTFENTWAATDYLLAPFNAQVELDPQPYWKIQVSPSGNYCFPVGVPRGVQIVGSWGFGATAPADVEEACLFQSALEFRSTPAILGNSGSGELSTEVRLTGLHPVTRRLLEPYRRIVVA